MTAARAVFFLALALALGCSPKAPERPERVVVVVLDALNAAHLSFYGGPKGRTPNLDRAAQAGLVFERAFSNNTWTLPSTTSLLTGLLQERHGVVTSKQRVPESAVLLPELFREAGFATAAFVQMTYASHAFGLEQGFDHYRYFGIAGGPLRESMPEEVVGWMEANAKRRYFLYVHVRRPHGVYNPYPALLAREDAGCPLAGGERDDELSRADTFGERELTDVERAHVLHLYRANLASEDYRLGPMLELALGDPQTLVVVLSDHGEALGEHGYFGHGKYLRPENVDIPLVFAGPGVRRGVDRGVACTLDVLPTLAELCGLELPEGLALDGESLARRLARALPADGRSVLVSARYASSGVPEVGLVRDDVGVVIGLDGEVRTFARGRRAARRATRAAFDPALLAELEARARAHRERFTDLGRAYADSVELSPELEADLDALGYGGETE